MPFTYTGIRVRDLRRSLTFYTKVMGLKKARRGRMKAGGIFVQLRDPRSRQVLELNYYPRATKYFERFRNGSELDHLAFWERDVDRKCEEMMANGATKAIEPFSEDGYRLAFVKDPDGIWIELLGKDRRARRKAS
jgi:lactoylglutathione lyase